MLRSITGTIKQNPVTLLWVLFGLAALAMTIRNLMLPSADAYTHYNNYVIFKQSFYHLIQGNNLYIHYPLEQYDLFKYSPAFALAMGCIAWMPDWLGLGIWNVLNVCVLVFAISKLPVITQSQKFVFGLLLIQETITATINSQSNGLIAGLLILGWIALENNLWWKAVLLVGITVFIKLFGIVFFAMFLLYPKWWKSIVPTIIITSLLLFIPFVFGGFNNISMQYQGYYDLLANDHGAFVKYSVMGWLKQWFGFIPEKNSIVLVGLAIQVAILFVLMIKKSTLHTRALYAGTWMIWMVIFNHMAESATFVIAVAGVLIWFYYSSLPKWLRLALLIPVMAFTCFGPSDIYPPALRELIVIQWQLKVFPCILVWAVCVFEIFRNSIFSLNTQPLLPLESALELQPKGQ